MMFHQFIKMCLFAVLVGLLPTVSAADINSRIFSFQMKIAESGNEQAQYKVAYMYEIGRGVKKDRAKAMEWYRKAAGKNFVAAKYRVKYLEAKQRGFKAQDASWVSEVKAIAGSADGETLYLLGELYENGHGTDKNLKKARRFYMLSKAKGNPDADIRVYALDQQLSKSRQAEQKERDRKAAEKKARLEEERKERAEQERARAEKAAKEKKLEAERKRLEAERKRLAAEKRKLEQQKKALAKKEAEKQEKEVATKAPEAKKTEGFESDLCSGAAARFMTQCD